MQSNNSIKVIAQGTYGCVLYPGPKCSGKATSKKYITKIQKLNTISRRETVIGEKIKKIKNYNRYFAPVIETCNVSLSIINDEELDKCDFLDPADKTDAYESNQIKYVGKNNIFDYFGEKMLSTANPKLFMEKLANSHIILLNGIQMLYSIGIIHFDIKKNNILCRDTTGRPIIIDFGLSFDIAQFEQEDYNYSKSFGIYGPEYGPWCIDICFLTYMATKRGTDWQTKQVTMLEMEKIIKDFMKQNTAITELANAEEQSMFKQKLMNYFSQFDRTTWKNVLDELLKYSGTWDNYSLVVVYLQMFKDLDLEMYESYSYIGEYKKILKQILLSMPNERMNITDTIAKISGIQ